MSLNAPDYNYSTEFYILFILNSITIDNALCKKERKHLSYICIVTINSVMPAWRNIPPPPFPNFILQTFLVINAFLKKIVRSFTFTSAFPSLADSLHIALIHFYLSISQSLMQSLFPSFRPTRNQGRDYYTVIKEDPRHFGIYLLRKT